MILFPLSCLPLPEASASGEGKGKKEERAYAHQLICQPNSHTYVAEVGHEIAGTYALRPNRAGGGSHVSNASFMVAPSDQRRGIGREMAQHCLDAARRLGFKAMQFNFVISTNEHAVRLWRQLGFEIVGTLPGAFQHPAKGLVDVYVMFRDL